MVRLDDVPSLRDSVFLFMRFLPTFRPYGAGDALTAVPVGADLCVRPGHTQVRPYGSATTAPVAHKRKPM